GWVRQAPSGARRSAPARGPRARRPPPPTRSVSRPRAARPPPAAGARRAPPAPRGRPGSRPGPPPARRLAMPGPSHGRSRPPDLRPPPSPGWVRVRADAPADVTALLSNEADPHRFGTGANLSRSARESQSPGPLDDARWTLRATGPPQVADSRS